MYECILNLILVNQLVTVRVALFSITNQMN